MPVDLPCNVKNMEEKVSSSQYTGQGHGNQVLAVGYHDATASLETHVKHVLNKDMLGRHGLEV